MSILRRALAELSHEDLGELIGRSPRKLREEAFRRLGIKAKGRSGFKLASRGDARASKLSEVLTSEAEVNEEILEEFVRNHLFDRRELLADALDSLGVEHTDGLTDEELDFMQELGPSQVEDLRKHLLERGHVASDITLYFGLMRLGSKRST